MSKDTNSITYKPRKSFKGFCSVRSYIVEKAINKGKNLIINFDGQSMTIPHDYLKYAGQLHKKKFKSKYDEKEYSLYDFFFVPNNETNLKPNKLEL